ncbi:hypothetical protein [Staphylococcus equorum]|uniref:hypothetical protein n=1 Tax=Staphylococcus equorum TaxID=246432 RepID=UPI000852D4B9|nr:hypothetical protein [Staphylococcus equorum]OEK68617.1 hypothetical protein AST02_08245 [Staphylococcus equorum]
MKKLLLASSITGLLLLTACSNEEEKTKESTKDKTEQDDKQEDKAKSSDKEATEEPTEQETQPSVEEQSVQDEQSNQVTQEPSQQDPVEEQTETGAVPDEGMNTENMPNGDAMFDMPGSADGYYSNDQLDPETGLPKDDAVPHKNGEGPTDEEIAKGEKEALREKYDGGLSSGEIQTKHAIEEGYYDGPNQDEVLEEIEQSEQEIADGKYDEYK